MKQKRRKFDVPLRQLGGIGDRAANAIGVAIYVSISAIFRMPGSSAVRVLDARHWHIEVEICRDGEKKDETKREVERKLCVGSSDSSPRKSITAGHSVQLPE